MIKDVVIGQYYPTDSVIHKLDPRTKIMATLLYIVFLFLASNIWGYFAAMFFLIVVVIISKIPVGYVLRGIKGVVFIILMTLVFNLLWTPGEALYTIGPVTITREGVSASINMALRLVLLISGTSMMTLTTPTIQLTDGMEALIKKVPFLGKVSHEISMMMSIALRFIPTLTEELDRIMKAQKSRGADFESKNIVKRVKGYVPLLVPLFVSAFQRANDLAMAMEARCYHGGEGRTRLKILRYEKRDRIAYAVVLFAMAGIFATRFITYRLI
ncbi:MAG: energy-coupling factor transporter transmembrane protein EcfT [Eubacteriaceae bacterium]|nr:energy-coupling factor transporter transmembrane protein EcfT [Eubacteriaceae bacterium]MBR5995509.1 energy-coupling factor transporter transmembrane protein EcfT [Eubacteriaceae bacterium]